MSRAHSTAPWSVDTVRNEDGEYGAGPDTSIGFDSYAVLDANGRILFDSLNSDAAEVKAVEHCLGVDAWDGVGLDNLTLAAAAPDLLEAAQAVLDAFANYERIGEVCPFEGNPMIYAATLVELADHARAAIAKATGAA